MFMFFVFPPLPACLGGWMKKKSGKVCFAISFIVLLALASIKEVQEQWTLGIYVATAVPNSFCNRDCISLLDTGSEKSKRQMGFLHHPQNSQELHTGLEQTWSCSLLGGSWNGNVARSCLALWQGCDSEQSPPGLRPVLSWPHWWRARSPTASFYLGLLTSYTK